MLPDAVADRLSNMIVEGLNAPDGAGCFPTINGSEEDVQRCLNAPDGAGCFPTEKMENVMITNIESQCT